MENACRVCRSVQKKLFLKGERCFSQKCPLIKRNYPAGEHGVMGRRRLTEYGRQLKEKQKVKAIYGLSESNLERIFEEAGRRKGDLRENLIQLLERRADNLLYRAGFFPSRKSARQAIVHGHITLNGERIKSPGLILKEGDTLQVKPSLKLTPQVKSEALAWLSVNTKHKTVKILHLPQREEIPSEIEEDLIVESLSR